ncbi:recombinase family protein [Rhodomicrobium vannielii]|uniref:recombinase family protein n=1 Tax=Rhodomicrobium vannielii TaxID=1069 RepID=UPI0001C251A6|nr:recombinase family protein [Rhodomicrobium vannielii]
MSGRAAIYARVSTVRQAEADLSIPDQIHRCEAWCKQKGYEVVEVFCEPGASALDDDRPVFQELIYKAKRSDHPFDLVIVHSLSRFSRDSMHSEFYFRALRKAGVDLVSITQDMGRGGNAEVARKMLNIFDEYQSGRPPSMCIAPCWRTHARASGTDRSRPSATVWSRRRFEARARRRFSSSTKPRRTPCARSSVLRSANAVTPWA